jgi:anti-sigma regulatory factor (Ser/Thr protein kinase)/serine/threonine protein phosphatase PrpC
VQDHANETLDVWYSADVYPARRAARARALAIGFSEPQCEEIALVVNELASNLVKHAKGGMIRLQPLTEGDRRGIRIESLDLGPGITDVDQAVADGFSTAGSLGYGLGTVYRLMDDVEIASRGEPERGTRILCTRWIAPERARSTAPCPLAFGAITRPHLSSEANGDAFVIKWWNESALVAVIDGLGHGQFALRAAQTARRYVESHHDQPLERLFQGVHRVCRATRGVVMALARFDLANGTMSFASVGNIEARAFGSPERISLIARRGVLGLNSPGPLVTHHRWEPRYMLVLHSDGLSTRWTGDDFPGLAGSSAHGAAQQLFRPLAKNHDDATVVVVTARETHP